MTEPERSPKESLAERCGRWLFRHRSYTLVPLVAAVAWPRKLEMAGFGFRELIVCTVAIGLFVLAEVVRLSVASKAKYRTCGRSKMFYASGLVTGGIYAHVRNPLYLANLIIWTGASLMTFHPAVMLAVAAVTTAQYYLIIRAEERFLLERFGRPYREYCRRVPRLVPRVFGDRASDTSKLEMPFNWGRGLLREHDTIFLLFLGAWGLLALRLGLVGEGAAVRPPAAWYAMPALATVGWLATKWIKKAWLARAGRLDTATGEQFIWPHERPFRVVVRSTRKGKSGLPTAAITDH